MARVAHTDISPPSTATRRATPDAERRLRVVLTGGHGHLNVTFLMRLGVCRWWGGGPPQRQGIFDGQGGGVPRPVADDPPAVRHARRGGHHRGPLRRRSAHGGLSQSGLVGMYPATSKLPTWTIAECVRLGLASLRVMDDPWPAWVRERAGLIGLLDAFPAVHRRGG